MHTRIESPPNDKEVHVSFTLFDLSRRWGRERAPPTGTVSRAPFCLPPEPLRRVGVYFIGCHPKAGRPEVRRTCSCLEFMTLRSLWFLLLPIQNGDHRGHLRSFPILKPLLREGSCQVEEESKTEGIIISKSVAPKPRLQRDLA